MKKDPTFYLEHIISAMEAILNFTEGIEEDAFYDNDLIQSAVIRKFEIIGEAAKRLPDDWRTIYPKIPWKQMAGFRDVLIHDYDDLNLEIIWQTIHTQLPNTVIALHKIRDSFA